MKRSEIYREAAQNMEANSMFAFGWSCWAICDVIGANRYERGRDKPVEVKDYELLFAPSLRPKHIWGRGWADTENECHGCRILALCFMACIAEDEERATGKKHSAGRSDNALTKWT